MKLHFYFLIIYFLSTEIKAQSSFLPGYYITSQSDTVKGYIEYRGESRNSRICIFRSDMNTPQEEFTPDKIAGYNIQNKIIYRSLRYVEKGNEKISFFRIIITGKVGLARKGSGVYFYKSAENKIYNSAGQEGNKLSNDQKIRLLNQLMSDCKRIQTLTSNQTTSVNNLKKIFIDYYNCVDQAYFILPKIKLNPRVSPEIQASLVMTKLSFHKPPADGSRFHFDPTFNIGINLPIFFPRIDERIRLVPGLAWGLNNSYSYFSNPSNVNNDLTIRYSYVRIPIVIRYTPGHLVFEGGIEGQKITGVHTTWRQENIIGNTVFTSNSSEKLLDPFNVGFTLGLGWGLKFTSKVELILLLHYTQFNSFSDKYYRPGYQNIEFKTGIDF